MSIGARIYAELRGDRVIWMIVAVLALFSIMIVYSATGSLAYKNAGGDTEAYLVKHVLILAFGLFMTYLAYLMHYMKYNKAAPWLLLIAIPLLVYTMAMGEDINQARRWISIPYLPLTFQTSDFAKLALILFVAREITRHKDYIKDFKSAFLPIIMPILIICGLIAASDLSTALLLFTTCSLMMFIGRVALKYIGLLVFLWVVVFSFLVTLGIMIPEFGVRTETWSNRLSSFLSKTESVYQADQAKIAIANGEIFGSGPGNSTQRNFLPYAYADFIYAIICEEYGLIGGFILLGLYVLLLFRATALVTKSEKSFGAMTAIGLSLVLVIQALINMAVSVELVPVTGLNMPMIGLGGSSLLMTCISFGIILSVSKYIESGFREPEIADAKPKSEKRTEERPQEERRSEDGNKGGQQRRNDGGQRRNSGGGNRSGGNRRTGGGGNRRSGGGNRNSGGNRGGGRDNRGGGGNRDGGGRNN